MMKETSFNLKDGMKIYGGFTKRDSLTARNFDNNPTVLSGDIDGNDVVTDGITQRLRDLRGNNSFHVVYADGRTTPINDATLLDGFVITGGWANGKSDNQRSGGGMYCNASQEQHLESPVKQYRFHENAADHGGGAMYNRIAIVPPKA
ncbi:MAG: hypothetical protein R2865_08915 [Deinococcales bacterium]